MARQSNWSKGGGDYSINDRIGGERIPVDGVEPLRSFASGTGRRKYDKNDASVLQMRKNRQKTYAKYGLGTTTATNSVAAMTRLKTSKIKIEDFKVGRRNSLGISNIASLEIAGRIASYILDINESISFTVSKETWTASVASKRILYNLKLRKVEDKYNLDITRGNPIKKRREETLLRVVRHMKKVRKSDIPLRSNVKGRVDHENKIKGLENL